LPPNNTSLTKFLARAGAAIVLLAGCGLLRAADAPFLKSELIFPLEHWHNHSSSIVEMPGGGFFVCWFHGSGERQSDDVVILGARPHPSPAMCREPLLLAATPNFPDTTPVVFMDAKQRLWLSWVPFVAN
jgi:predicted neuraminidase